MEGNLYYKMLKLINGDTIICKTDDSCINLYDRPFINIIEPIMLNLIRIPKQTTIIESYILVPWMSFTEDDVLEIPTSQILVAANPKKELISNYVEYTMYKNIKESSIENDIPEDDTEDILDEMLNAIQRGEENAEEEEERDGGFDRGSKGNTRILH